MLTKTPRRHKPKQTPTSDLQLHSMSDPKDDDTLLPVDDKVQHVFDMLVACTHGEVTDNAVEDAIQQLIPDGGNGTTIHEDTDDYDNLPPRQDHPERTISTDFLWTGPTVTLEELRKEEEEGKDPFDRIPMGHVGKKMVMTFGGGSNPSPEVVQAALLGARRLLQIAIKDARALRRQMKGEYAEAKRAMHMGNKNVKPMGASIRTAVEGADPTLYYRAMDSHDRLSANPKCGFDIEQLQQLFPEEMTAYNRWNQMHEEYESSKQTEAERKEKAARDEANKEQLEEQTLGGHLTERALNFDVRTDVMNNDVYLKFASVRRGGSFLPRKSKADRDEIEWETMRPGGRGRRKDGTWEFMSIITVKFLHWVGFDPKSELPPPNDETTEALGFLGFDCMGRIIEKAIQLRLGTSDANDQIPEMPASEQLDLDDIVRAINDSAIRPIPLYAGDESSSKRQAAAQLYFGPGFERRVEMEMDELLEESCKKRKRLTDEELQERKREDDLFAALAKPPKLLDDFTELVQ